MNDFHDMAWPSLSTIQGETGLSRPTVVKYLADLEKNGWLVKDSSKHKSMTYIAVLPQHINQLVKELNQTSKGDLPVLVNDVYPNKQRNKQENNNDPVTPTEQPNEHWDYDKCKTIWNEVKSEHECPATGCNIVPDSLKSGLLRVHKAYVKYCKDNNKTELERHEWFRAYAKGHLKRCLSFVGKNESYSWKPSIKDLGKMKTFEALINQ